MEENVFLKAVAAISVGEYSKEDLSAVKERLKELSKKELTLKRKMERDKNAFVKAKSKLTAEIKILRKDIQEIKNILKNI